MSSHFSESGSNRAAVAIPMAVVLVIGAYVAAQVISDVGSLKIGVVFGIRCSVRSRFARVMPLSRVRHVASVAW